ncbi:hypothetical protein AM228_27140 [Planktothricoides sp. SR001]|nr:hypothetical protein AM228_27140 [Planktothricoides sp. SR001]
MEQIIAFIATNPCASNRPDQGHFPALLKLSETECLFVFFTPGYLPTHAYRKSRLIFSASALLF